jgi:hypothetical protein
MPTLSLTTFTAHLAWFPMLGLWVGGAWGRGWRLEYSCPLRRVCCQADGLAYASTMGWMRVEPQQRNARPSEEEQSGSMNLPIVQSVLGDRLIINLGVLAFVSIQALIGSHVIHFMIGE